MTHNRTTHFDENARFPLILHALLEDAKEYDFEHIISWVSTSDFFIVHKPKQFAQIIMKRYFTKQNRYKSFLRQLNIYGFERVSSKSSNPAAPRGAYCHPLFQRDSPDLCGHMGRPKARNIPVIKQIPSDEACVRLPIEAKAISSYVGIVSYPTECRLVNESDRIPDAFADDIIWLFGQRNVPHTK
jgi:hypothetical protein